MEQRSESSVIGSVSSSPSAGITIATETSDILLLYPTDPHWVEEVLKHFPLFVADHAANERKAAAAAMEFVVRYPDRISLVSVAARIAEEEIHHFRLLFDRMKKEGIPLRPDEKDLYARELLSQVRTGRKERLLDRLLIHSLFEMRGIERFELLARNHPDKEWQCFYRELSQSERGHSYVFYKEATRLFPLDRIESRFETLLKIEADICRKMLVTWRFH